MIEIDAKGLECPKPVLLTKKEIDAGADEICVIVDNETARGNVLRLAESEGFAAEAAADGSNFRITMKRTAPKADAAAPADGACNCGCGCEDDCCCCDCDKWVMFIGRNVVGAGADELGGNLMKMMLFTLAESDNVPEYLLLMNGGVQLACGEAPTVEHLQKLVDKGVKLLVCGTCLNYYGIAEDLKVGTVSNMYDILSKMQDACKVVTF